MNDLLGAHVSGQTLALAAKVKEALEKESLAIETEYGTFFVAKVELRWADGGDSEVVGYVTPDEHTGESYDFWTPRY